MACHIDSQKEELESFMGMDKNDFLWDSVEHCGGNGFD